MSVRDAAGANVKDLQIALNFSQYQLTAHSQYFLYSVTRVNYCDLSKWLAERIGDFKNEYAFRTSKVEVLANNNA